MDAPAGGWSKYAMSAGIAALAAAQSGSSQVIKSDTFQTTFLHISFERYDGLSSHFQSIFFYLPI